MKLAIAGTRTFDLKWLDIKQFVQLFELHFSLKEVVEGGATGVDAAAAQFAEVEDYPHTRFNAEWDKHGKAAGPIRNLSMAQYADALLLIWDGQSKGSANMKDTMIRIGKPVYEVILRSYEPRPNQAA